MAHTDPRMGIRTTGVEQMTDFGIVDASGRNRPLWKARHKQRYAQNPVMHSWYGSATSPPSQADGDRAFELRIVTGS